MTIVGTTTRLLSDPAMRTRFGRAGYAKVLADHDWPVVVDCVRAIYAGVAES
jgi:hypothetical protein